MTLPILLPKIAAFFRRDLSIARAYRGAFVLEILESLFAVATFYFLSRFVQSEELKRALPQGQGYFAFVLVGFAFFDFQRVSLEAFEASIQEARQNGTLESMLVTQTTLPVILAGSGLYPFAMSALRTVVYLLWGAAIFKFPAGGANWAGGVLVLVVSILAFAGLGILSASYVLLFKRGNPAKWVVIGVSGLLSGMMYPVSVLPPALQFVAKLVPATYSLEGMRAALLTGAPLQGLWPSLRALLAFAGILLPLSFATFAWALNRTKVTGTLTHL
jgi:ABC-2 type transport system permease protein